MFGFLQFGELLTAQKCIIVTKKKINLWQNSYQCYPNPDNFTPSRMVWMVISCKSERRLRASWSKQKWKLPQNWHKTFIFLIRGPQRHLAAVSSGRQCRRRSKLFMYFSTKKERKKVYIYIYIFLNIFSKTVSQGCQAPSKDGLVG